MSYVHVTCACGASIETEASKYGDLPRIVIEWQIEHAGSTCEIGRSQWAAERERHLAREAEIVAKSAAKRERMREYNAMAKAKREAAKAGQA